MKKTFEWQKLSRPFSVLAPMGGVTDFPFREVISRYGKPDVIFTEFVNVDSLESEGKKAEMERLRFSEAQRPIIAQLWGNNPERFYSAARLVSDLEFDGIDINMGCSIRKILSREACGSLIEQPSLSVEIIDAVKNGAKTLPISVKTRLGTKSFSPEWFELLLSSDISALTVHGRTVTAGYRDTADWEKIGRIARIRDRLKCNTLIIGNGDANSSEEAHKLCETYGIDGYMIGRAILRDFWLFSHRHLKTADTKKAMLEHMALVIDELGPDAPAKHMRKYYKMYLRSFEGAAGFRHELMNTKTLKESLELVMSLK